MQPKVRKLYNSAIKNEKFLQNIKDADNDCKPSVSASNEEKVLFASVYYGWLVSEHGIAWELYF